MKRLLLVLLFIFLIFKPVFAAVDCEGTPPSGADKVGEINEYIESCAKKINSLKTEQNSLKQVLATITSKINLTQGQINQTDAQIKAVEKEIEVLGGVIDKVNESSGALSKIYIARVQESYRRVRTNKENLFFASSDFSDYFSKLKYLNTVKSKDQLILSELEKSRQDYDSRRSSKQEKQKEIESLKKKMLDQKKSLDSQQKEKQNLLNITANDEKKYQKLQTDAKAQLAAIRRFVSSNGGATILKDQTKCDGWGCYYNQRDSQWGNIGLGGSSYSTAEYGCLVNSISMMASHAGKNIKPGDIAANASAFVPGTGYILHSFSVNGVGVSITPVGKDKLDSELNAGRSVIAGLHGGPDHFIVIVKKDGDKYIMHDPFLENGSNRPLTDKYQLSDISSLRLVSFN